MSKIYNIDTEKEITPVMVRDAILLCFKQAHCDDLEVDVLDEDIKTEYCKNLVKNIFDEVGGNFDNPTKQDLQKVIKGLAEFSESFRDKEIILKHFNEIMTLINKIK